MLFRKKLLTIDGYSAVQVGFESVAAANANKPHLGHCTKSGHGVFRHLREFKNDQVESMNVGDEITVNQFVS